MRNKIRVETEEDSLYLADDKIHAIADSEEHRCYKSFLFDQIGKVLPIDYEYL